MKWRILNRLKFLFSCGFVIFVGSLSSTLAQGPLSPPGIPAPTMRTLDQLESRIPITNIPFTISTSGSYYLTGNFTGTASTNGITINASSVTLDLEGHTLMGVTDAVDGVNVAFGRQAIIIRNGIVRNWGGDGIDAGAASIHSVKVVDIVAVTNGGDGIKVNSLSEVLQCVASANAGNGILGNGIACLVEDCVASVNLLNGISVPTSSKVSDCTARDNFDDGFALQGGCALESCSSVANDGAGIRVTGPGCIIVNCTATASGAEGIHIASKDAYVFNNIFDQNGGAGIAAGILITNVTSIGNRIDSNHVTENDIGILIVSPSNFVIRNSVRGSLLGPNFAITNNNSVGGIVNVAGSGITNLNPWANFEF